MALQFLPILKAVTPYIAQVATAAIPAFTSRPKDATSDAVVARQIEELQQASTQNAESVHLLAEQLQQTIESLEAASEEAQRQVSTYKGLIAGSLLLSLVSLGLCLYLLSQ